MCSSCLLLPTGTESSLQQLLPSLSSAVVQQLPATFHTASQPPPNRPTQTSLTHNPPSLAPPPPPITDASLRGLRFVNSASSSSDGSSSNQIMRYSQVADPSSGTGSTLVTLNFDEWGVTGPNQALGDYSGLVWTNAEVRAVRGLGFRVYVQGFRVYAEVRTVRGGTRVSCTQPGLSAVGSFQGCKEAVHGLMQFGPTASVVGAAQSQAVADCTTLFREMQQLVRSSSVILFHSQGAASPLPGCLGSVTSDKVKTSCCNATSGGRGAQPPACHARRHGPGARRISCRSPTPDGASSRHCGAHVHYTFPTFSPFPHLLTSSLSPLPPLPPKPMIVAGPTFLTGIHSSPFLLFPSCPPFPLFFPCPPTPSTQ